MAGARAFWLRQLHAWHWVSAALSLAGMLLFAVTGITLNHAASLPASPLAQEHAAKLPDPLRTQLGQWPEETSDAVPPELAAWIRQTFSFEAGGLATETTPDEIYIERPVPGGSRTLEIDRESGMVRYQASSRGWIAYMNDLHKGRHTGAAWSWFIDALAASCILFTLTGLALLAMHGRQRPATWPVTAFSLLLPLLIALLFMH